MMKRVAVIGSSGSGKTTTAKQIADLLNCPALELDGIFHQANWQPLEDELFRQRVGDFIERESSWVTDGNYRTVRQLIWSRADTIVWLDLPLPSILRALLWRTLRRGFVRAPLWNGNRENLFNIFSLDPERSVLVWSYTHHERHIAEFEGASRVPENAHLEIIRLRSRREVADWLEALRRETKSGTEDVAVQIENDSH